MQPPPADPGVPSAAPLHVGEITTIDLPASQIGASYLLVEPIGGGATGEVWRAVDRGTDEPVAVKLLRRELMSEPKAVSRFVQERSILLMLRHPHIVGVRDLLTIGDSLGLVMDLVPGGSLREYVRRHGTLAPAVAAQVCAQLAEALAEAHRLGVVHRDVKPDNVLVDAETGTTADAAPHTRLTDFGIARLLDSPGMTTTLALVGTPNYLAPEIITGGQPSPAMDVYALGVLLYELLLGRPPYGGGQPVVVLRRHLECAPHRFPGVPDEAWRAVLACMDKDPRQRPSAESLVTTMRSLAKRAGAEPPAPPAPESSPDQPSTPGSIVIGRPPAATGGDRAATSGGGRPAPSANGRSAGRSGGKVARTGPPAPSTNGRPAAGHPARRRRLAVALLVSAVALGLLATVAGAAGLPDWLAGMLRDGGAQTSAGGPGGTPSPTKAPHRPAGVASASPSPLATGRATAAAEAATSARQSRTGRRDRLAPGVRVPIGEYGQLTCTTEYQWDVGHPVVAQPCHATGPGIELFGRLQALPGVQADVTLTLQEVATGRTVAGPYPCPGLMFTDFQNEHDCGPFHARNVPHGSRFTVVQRWVYTGRAVLPGGTARSDPFDW